MVVQRSVFRLYACCLPVRGARRSTICDVQRAAYHLIPNVLYEILTDHRDRTLDEIKAVYGPASGSVVDEYFTFLAERDLGFWTDEPEAFPEMDRTFDAPEVISNAIIDADADSAHDYGVITAQLADLGCKALQLRFFAPLALARIDDALRPTMQGSLRSIEILLAWTEECTAEALRALTGVHRRISSVVVHSAPSESVVRDEGGDGVPIFFRAQKIDSHTHCGEVHPGYFALTLKPFVEAMRFNSCLNRKVSVDVRGEIRNCPSLPASFGNIARTSLHAAVMQRDFRDLWEVNKDQVEICKDCEFRYVCQDCRAWIRDPGDRLSKPAKCGYDPYTAQWEAAPA